jgi:hypothetical protein
VIVGMSSLARAMQTTGSREQDVRVAEQIRKLDPRLTLRDRIQEANRLMGPLPAGGRPLSERATADLMAQLAQTEIQNNQTATAENYLVQATELDPSNVKSLATLGDLYAQRARSAGNEERVMLLQQSGDALQKASVQTTDASSRTRYQERAAQAYLDAAIALHELDPGQRSAIRDLLNNARSAAPAGSPVVAKVDEWQRWLRSQQGQ